ncbi:hypothetical protein COO60DRAFT_1506416 [Scenedesmus sp. NREL 46B-D3]|nr:hypothetical protein COO60DRAFT_1506416 [Scenedesmus sp. NREL 46B-D3]
MLLPARARRLCRKLLLLSRLRQSLHAVLRQQLTLARQVSKQKQQMTHQQAAKQQPSRDGARSALPGRLQTTAAKPLPANNPRPTAMLLQEQEPLLVLLLLCPKAPASKVAGARQLLTRQRWRVQLQLRVCCRHAPAARQLQMQQQRWRSSWVAARQEARVLMPLPRRRLLLLPSRQPPTQSRHVPAKSGTATG